jgi:hypothetical protein
VRSILVFALIFILFLFGSVLGSPTASMQGVTDMPDLSGINIYFSEANAEYGQFDRSGVGVSRFSALLRLMGANTFTLEWRKGIPADAHLVIIPNPKTVLTSEMVARLWPYLQRGGRVLLVVDALDSTGAPSRAQVGLFELTWSDLGIRARNDVLVVPGELREVTLPATDTSEARTVSAPLLVTALSTQRVNPDHPITNRLLPYLGGDAEEADENLSSLYFNSARSIELNGALSSASITPLIFADVPETYGESAYADYTATGYSEFNIGSDTAPGDLIMAAAFDDPVLQSRMIVLGDADFLQNGAGFLTSPAYTGAFVYPNNVRFMVNAVAWLLGRDISDILLPPPGPTATPTITPSPTAVPLPTATPAPDGT